MRYIVIVFAILIMGLGVKINMMKSDYDSILIEHAKELQIERDKVKVLEAKEAVSLANEEVYKATIDDINAQISKYKLDIVRKNKELNDYKKLPDGVKYKKMYDRIKNTERTDDDCKRYEDINDAFNGFDINSL